MNISTTTEQKQQLAQAVIDYFEESKRTAEAQGKKLSQNIFAERLNITSGQLGYILTGKYDEAKNTAGNLLITDRIWTKLQRQLGLDLDVWETANYERCMTTFMECKLNAEQRIIDGSTRMGKSFAAEMFVRKYPANTYLVTCSTDMNAKQFMQEFAKAVGVRTEYLGLSRYDLRLQICEKLLQDTKPHVIFDEFENARAAVAGAIKDVFDYKHLHRHVAMTIMGANDFVQTLENRTKNKVKHCWPQFLGRFGTDPVYLSDYDKREAGAICNTYGIGGDDRKRIVDTARNLDELDGLIKRHLADKELFTEKEAA